MKRYILALSALFVLGFAPLAAAQAEITPTSRVAFELDPGRMRSGATVVPRPDANLAFDFRVDGGAPVAAVKAAPCVPAATSPQLTCQLVPPTMPEGTHTIEIRALTNPAEAGVDPSGYSAPLSVAILIVTSPGTPTSVRLTPE